MVTPRKSTRRRAQFSEALRDDIRVRQTRLRALAHERKNRCAKGFPKCPRLNCADMRIFESSEGLGGKVVVAARLHHRQPLSEAGKGECVVAHGADVMLGLPDSSTFYARARVECVDDAPPEEVVRT